MASRLVTTSFAIVSAAALLAGCDTVSGWFDGNSSRSSASSGTSQSRSNDTYASNRSTDSYGSSYGSSGYDRSGATVDNTAGLSTRASESVSADKVRRAQHALKDQGLYKGPIDGVVGPQTRDAVARYQRDHNLKQTAMLDDQTLRALDPRMSTNTRR